jgi:hypothetical protein
MQSRKEWIKRYAGYTPNLDLEYTFSPYFFIFFRKTSGQSNCPSNASCCLLNKQLETSRVDQSFETCYTIKNRICVCTVFQIYTLR